MTPDGLMQQAQQQADDISAEAMAAFDKARAASRQRRNWQESAAGIKAALDDATPEKFVQEFIVGGAKKASYDNVKKLAKTAGKDPEAKDAIKQGITGYLRDKALGVGTADETGRFRASSYNSALKSIGGSKLKLFFTPEEIADLKAVGRVAAYETFQPRGSAVNNSGTTGALAGLLERIAGSPVVRMTPFAGPAIGQPASNMAKRLQATEALTPGLLAPAAQGQAGGSMVPYAALPMLLGQPANATEQDQAATLIE